MERYHLSQAKDGARGGELLRAVSAKREAKVPIVGKTIKQDRHSTGSITAPENPAEG